MLLLVIFKSDIRIRSQAGKKGKGNTMAGFIVFLLTCQEISGSNVDRNVKIS